MTPIPTLTTPRVTLRAPKLADFDALAAFYAGPRSRHVGGPLTREQAWRALAGEIGHWSLRGYGRWAVEERASGGFAGMVGLWFPEGWPEPEIGWTLIDGFEGRGLATQAALAAREHAYGVLGWSTAISLIASANSASQAVARRMGARPDGRFTHERFGEMDIWRHPSPGDVADGGMEAYA
ncbi:MAG: GNAT family N-acetyltransferase [Rhodobacteraceae bacterium]|nr:GNAT family N-acetyltransferase [Paracoccaceae bacterium]